MEHVKRITLLVIGETGAGKSTVLNKLSGSEIFETGDSASCVTKQVKGPVDFDFEGIQLRVYDVPGLNDAEHTIVEWHEMLRKGVQNLQIDILLVVTNGAQPRASLGNVLIELAIQTFFKHYSAHKAVLVFSRCDQDINMSLEKANSFAQELKKKSGMNQEFTKFIFFKKNRESLMPLKDLLQSQQEKMIVDQNPDMKSYVLKANNLLDPQIMQALIRKEAEKLENKYKELMNDLKQEHEIAVQKMKTDIFKLSSEIDKSKEERIQQEKSLFNQIKQQQLEFEKQQQMLEHYKKDTDELRAMNQQLQSQQREEQRPEIFSQLLEFGKQIIPIFASFMQKKKLQ